MHQLQEMHPLSLKEGFLLGMCKKKGLGLFTLLWAYKKKKKLANCT